MPEAPAEWLYLDQESVLAAGVLDMNQAMHAVGQAFALLEQGQARQPEKVVLRFGDSAECEQYGRINGLSAYLGGPVQAMGMKWIASFPANRDRGLPRASALLILNDPTTGLPLAVMDGTLISSMRTGAVTGLGVRHLAPFHARKAAVIGAGVQAHTQILGLCSALPELEEIALANRSRAHVETLAGEISESRSLPLHPVDTISEAVDEADVVITVTTASQPIIAARWIKPGALTVQLSGHECEFDVIRQCRKFVTDSWDAIKHRGIMTPALMHAQGLLRDDDIYARLGQILLGLRPGRESGDERIHFAHMGLGIADVALGWEIYQTAKTHGLGQPLTLWKKPLWV